MLSTDDKLRLASILLYLDMHIKQGLCNRAKILWSGGWIRSSQFQAFRWWGAGEKLTRGKKREETRVKKGTKRVSSLSTQSPLIFSLIPCISFNSLAPHHLNIGNRLDKKGRKGKRGKGKGGKRTNYREKVGHFRSSLHTNNYCSAQVIG